MIDVLKLKTFLETYEQPFLKYERSWFDEEGKSLPVIENMTENPFDRWFNVYITFGNIAIKVETTKEGLFLKWGLNTNWVGGIYRWDRRGYGKIKEVTTEEIIRVMTEYVPTFDLVRKYGEGSVAETYLSSVTIDEMDKYCKEKGWEKREKDHLSYTHYYYDETSKWDKIKEIIFNINIPYN